MICFHRSEDIDISYCFSTAAVAVAGLAMLIKTLNEDRRARFPWTRAPGDRAEV